MDPTFVPQDGGDGERQNVQPRHCGTPDLHSSASVLQPPHEHQTALARLASEHEIALARAMARAARLRAANKTGLVGAAEGAPALSSRHSIPKHVAKRRVGHFGRRG